MPGTRQAPNRSAQRARTRKALVDAAADLLRADRPVTVADAAAAAEVHRATAYRYFPTPEALRSEVALTAVAPSPEQLTDGVGDDPFALLDAVVRGFAGFAFGDEALIRENVRATVERWSSGGVDDERESRRFDYLGPVLSAIPDGLSGERGRLLRSALALVFGAEAVVVTRGVCGLEPDEATEVMRWAAATLLAGFLADDAVLRPAGGQGAGE